MGFFNFKYQTVCSREKKDQKNTLLKSLARKCSDIESSHLRPIQHIDYLQEFSIFLTQIWASAHEQSSLKKRFGQEMYL